MKYKLLIIFTVIITAAAFFGCNKDDSESSQDSVKLDKETSYALGMLYGASIRENVMNGNAIIPDIDEFIKGMRNGITEKDMKFTMEKADEIVQIAFKEIEEKEKIKAKEKENEFLKENASKPGVQMTANGLQYEIIQERTGPKPSMEDTVLAHYEEKLTTGQFLDSTYTRGYPEALELSMLPAGWAEGIQLMSVGSKYRFTIPSTLGYGEDGVINEWTGQLMIPPFLTIVLEIELLEINPKTGE